MLKEIVLYRILGMPTPAQREAVKTGRKTWKRKPKQDDAQAPAPEATASNPWIASAADEEEPPRPPTTPRSAHGGGGVFWVEHEETKKDTLWRYVLRGGVATILVLLLITGLRVWIVDGLLGGNEDEGTAAPALPAAVVFPDSAASGVAERYTRSYLTWDEDDADKRGDELARDGSPQSLGEKAGWNGRGRQSVSTAAVVGVDVTSAKTARITVAALTTTSVKDGDKWKPQPAQWQTLEVPVAATGDRITVTGLPGLVAMPPPATIDPGDEPELDSTSTTASQPDAETFFEAYANEDDVSALSAPGSKLAGIANANMKFSALSSWAVYAGDDKTRAARAVVSWELPGETIITQPYDVRLVAVGDGDSTRWQIAAVKGGAAGTTTKK